MCGIFGIVSDFYNTEFQMAFARRALAAMTSRGPDGSGTDRRRNDRGAGRLAVSREWPFA